MTETETATPVDFDARDASRMRSYADVIAQLRARYPDKQVTEPSPTSLIPYYESQVRVRVRTEYDDGLVFERTGTVSMTGGWSPAFMLMHRSNAHGSWDLLDEKDRVIAVKRGRTYDEV